MVQGDGYSGFSLAVRKDMGLSLSEIKSDRNFVASAIEGFAEDRQLLAIMAVSVYIP